MLRVVWYLTEISDFESLLILTSYFELNLKAYCLHLLRQYATFHLEDGYIVNALNIHARLDQAWHFLLELNQFTQLQITSHCLVTQQEVSQEDLDQLSFLILLLLFYL